MNQIDRISKMEQNLDDAEAAISSLRSALEEYISVQPNIVELYEYYKGGDWMKDYETDAEGLLPHGLKRGVLSEDGIFNMMSDNRELLDEMAKLSNEIINSLP